MDETKKNETYKELTVKEWAEKFKPVANLLREDADLKGYDRNHPKKGILFCLTGQNETQYVEHTAKYAPARVWSFFSNKGCDEYAVNGYSGDASGYFITSVPCEPDMVYFIDDDRSGEAEISNYE